MWRGHCQLSVSPPKLPMPAAGAYDEPDVLDLQLADLVPLQPFEERRHRAAEAVLLACGGLRLDALVDDIVARPVGRLRVDVSHDGVRDILYGNRHVNARAGSAPELLCFRLGEEAVDHQVLFRLRVVLKCPLDAVVVRDDQSVRRHERRAAAAERDDGAHRESGQIGEGLRITGEPERREAVGKRRDLLGHPHPLVRDGRQGRKDENQNHEKAFHR